MSSVAYFVFKYKGKYYVFYNRHDGYLDGPYGLGFRIIQNLKGLTRETLVELLELLAQQVILEDEHPQINSSSTRGEPDFISIEHALTNPYSYNEFVKFSVKTKEPTFAFYGKEPDYSYSEAEYIYIINLDQNLFVIRDRIVGDVEYSLFHIPEDWYDLYTRVFESKYECEE